MAETKVQRYRGRMRSLGNRLAQHWIPDARTPEFKSEAERQCRLVSDRVDPEDGFAFPEAFMLTP